MPLKMKPAARNIVMLLAAIVAFVMAIGAILVVIKLTTKSGSPMPEPGMTVLVSSNLNIITY